MTDSLRESDASFVAVKDDADAEPAFYLVIPDEGEGFDTAERERIVHELYKSAAHFLARHMNPLAVMMGGGPPQPIPRSAQPSPSDDRVDTDPSDAIDAVERATFVASLHIRDARENVDWDDPEGAGYHGGMALDESQQDAMHGLMDAISDFATQDSAGPSGGPSGGGPGGLPF